MQFPDNLSLLWTFAACCSNQQMSSDNFLYSMLNVLKERQTRSSRLAKAERENYEKEAKPERRRQWASTSFVTHVKGWSELTRCVGVQCALPFQRPKCSARTRGTFASLVLLQPPTEVYNSLDTHSRWWNWSRSQRPVIPDSQIVESGSHRLIFVEPHSSCHLAHGDSTGSFSRLRRIVLYSPHEAPSATR